MAEPVNFILFQKSWHLELSIYNNMYMYLFQPLKAGQFPAMAFSDKCTAWLKDLKVSHLSKEGPQTWQGREAMMQGCKLVWFEGGGILSHRISPFPKMFFKSINWDIPLHTMECARLHCSDWSQKWVWAHYQGSSRKFLLSCLHNTCPSSHNSPILPAQAGLPWEIYHLLGLVPLFVDICIYPP